MTASFPLLDLLAGIALLVFATRMVKTAVIRAFGDRLRRVLGQATAGPLRACGAGMGVATALQSSSATALLAASFADRGLLALAPGLALMLGADIGSTLAVQILSTKPLGLAAVLLVTGVPVFVLCTGARTRQVGRILVGIALVMIALAMILAASAPLRTAPTLVLVMEQVSGELGLAFVLGLALAWIAHSSLAAVLMAMALASNGVVPLPFALAFVLGANLGSALIPLPLALRAGATARRLLLGNLAFRALGAVALLAVLSQAAPPLAWLGADAGRGVANAHTGFNLLLALVFLPLTGLAARLLERVVPDPRPAEPDLAPAAGLAELRPARTPEALAAATRETMRLADTVEVMLRESIEAFHDGDERRRDAVRRLDDEVDARHEEIKLFLVRLERSGSSEEDSRRCFDMISFATNLEHAGDIVDKGILRLAARKHRRGVAFSEEGWAEIRVLHERVVAQMRLAVGVFISGDVAMARALVREKDAFREAERAATENHLQRLRDGAPASVETSALHLDLLRDLKRIVAHLTTVAYPLLEAEGALRGSRLIEAAAAQPVRRESRSDSV